MGFFRGAGIAVVSALLFISLLLAGIFASVSLSLNYENIQPRVYSIADEIINNQIGGDSIVNEITPYLNTFCRTNTEVVHSFEGYNFVFPCTVIQQGRNSIINYTVNYLTSDFYYKEYNCSFVKCFENSKIPLFLVSDYARQFWRALFIKSLLVSLVLAGLVVLLVERKANAFILTGSLLISVSLIILIIERIGAFVAKIVLSPVLLALSKENITAILSQIVEMFFSASSRVFLWMFVAGLILIISGVVLRITGIGIKISQKIEELKQKASSEEKVSKEDVKNIVKEELSKKDIQKPKQKQKK